MLAHTEESIVTMPEFDSYRVLQSTVHSVGALCVVIDSFQRKIDEMYKWPYADKDEMKHLGGTMIQMNEKFVEFIVLGVSKVVEDAFNLLAPVSPPKFGIWSHDISALPFVHEVRWVRHVGNVIKHHNSVIESAAPVPGKKPNSCDYLVNHFGANNHMPIAYLPELRERPARDSLLRHVYYAYTFSSELSAHLGHGWRRRKELTKEEIPNYMLDRFVRDLPGHPERGKDG